MSTLPKGYDNLGKPVTIERVRNAMQHMAEMYPDWTKGARREVVMAARRLVEQDEPDELWGCVNASPPLDTMDWINRMRLGAALLAEPTTPTMQESPALPTIEKGKPTATPTTQEGASHE